MLYKCNDIIVLLVKLTQDAAPTVAKNSLLALVNLSADAEGATVTLEAVGSTKAYRLTIQTLFSPFVFYFQDNSIIDLCVRNILSPECELADAWAMVLSNISRPEPLVESIVASVQSQIRELVSAFTQIEFNQKKCHLNYLGRCDGHASPKPI